MNDKLKIVSAKVIRVSRERASPVNEKDVGYMVHLNVIDVMRFFVGSRHEKKPES